MMFSLSKERMESTKLWRIVHKMPKGALLHAHMDAMVEFDYLLDLLLREPGIHIRANSPLSSTGALDAAAVVFQFRKTAQIPDCGIWEDEYKPGTLTLLTHAADTFPQGGRDGFLKWLYSRCTLSRTEATEQHHGVNEIWQKFQSCFGVVDSIIHYEPIFRAFLRRLLQSLKADGVNYAEIRFSWILNYHKNGCEEPESDYSVSENIKGSIWNTVDTSHCVGLTRRRLTRLTGNDERPRRRSQSLSSHRRRPGVLGNPYDMGFSSIHTHSEHYTTYGKLHQDKEDTPTSHSRL
jgi:adenosine deaminase CECR1